MRRWEDSTFVFISTNQQARGGVEERWLPVMRELMDRGASVRFLTLMDSPMGDWARKLGIPVDPYILDKWNVIRSRSRLRKYLKRYVPVVAHSTGIEADLLLRWASRKVPIVRVAHTLSEEPEGTRRRRPVDALMRRFDELGMRSHADVVFVPSFRLAEEVHSVGVPEARVVLDDMTDRDSRHWVHRHVEVYRDLMAERGQG